MKIISDKKTLQSIILVIVIIIFATPDVKSDGYSDNKTSYRSQSDSISIKSQNGNFYAYIVLLFNENPHFVNMIQKDSIPLKIVGNEGFHVKEYKNYLNRLNNYEIKKLSKLLLAVYLEPGKFGAVHLRKIEKILSKRNIILKFSRDRNSGFERISLDYCIFGKKKLVMINHPLFRIKERIYNIQPYIYYDEFSTSNSTFYYDMIYINPGEVQNDYIIAKKIIKGESVNSLFFVGSSITGDIKYCLKKTFKDTKNIRKEIWKMFIIHELTHKILNNQYNNFDQITGEELSLCSTIYSNPYLGLSVLYSYMNYNVINPHRIAAINFIRFVAKQTGNAEMINNPGLVKFLMEEDLRKLSKLNFNTNIKKIK